MIHIEVIASTEIINHVQSGDLILCQTPTHLKGICSKLVANGIKAQIEGVSPIALELLSHSTTSTADNVFLVGCNIVSDELAAIAVGCAIKKLYCIPIGSNPSEVEKLLTEPYGGMIVPISTPTEPAYPIGTTFNWLGRSGFVVTSVRSGKPIDCGQWMYKAKSVQPGIHWGLAEYPHHLMRNVQRPFTIAAQN